MSQIQKNKILFIGLIAIFAIMYMSTSYEEILKQIYSQTPSDEETQAIQAAKAFVISGPTYSFDGINSSVDVKSVKMLKSYPPQYVVDISFESSHVGHGNRTEQILAQVITPHVISVRVVNNTIMSAAMDEIWDELNHKLINNSNSNSTGIVSEEHNKPSVPQLAVPMILQSNHTTIFGKHMITFSKIIQDSRCPADVICIRAGDATIQVDITSDKNEKNELKLKLGEDNSDAIQTFDGYSVKLEKLEPYPLSSVPTLGSDYVATISILSDHVSPRQQIKNGVLPEDVMCAKGFVLIQKISKNTSGCVSQYTAKKLEERGWGILF